MRTREWLRVEPVFPVDTFFQHFFQLVLTPNISQRFGIWFDCYVQVEKTEGKRQKSKNTFSIIKSGSNKI